MRFLWRTTWKEWQRQRRAPLEFAVWLGVPLLIGLLLVLITGGRGGPKPQAHLLVVDQDESVLSRFLVGALSQEAAGSFIRAEGVQLHEGNRRIQKGEATALLVIPEGFSSAVLLEEPCTLRLVTNPSERILPDIVEESLSMFTDGVFYLQRFLGDDLRLFAQEPPEGRNTFDDAQIAAFSLKVNHLAERLGNSLSPLLIRLETQTDEQDETAQDTPSLALLFLPGILFMSLLFIAQGLSEDLWRERDQKTLRRLVVSPQSVTAFLTGKALFGSLLMASVCLVALAAGFAYFQLPWSRLPLSVLWTTLAGSMLLLVMMILQLHAPSQRAGNILSFTVMFPLMMLGGSFFPFEAMPHWMVTVGRFTPNGWALRQLKAVLGDTVNPEFIRNLGFLVLLILGLIGWGTGLLEKRFSRERT